MKTAIIFIISILTFFTSLGVVLYQQIEIDRNCLTHLKLASDANTVELASEQLSIAINYLEAEQLTEGYTSVVYNTPDDDIGFFYKNLKSSQEELNKVTQETSMLERTNILMKLRETLLDHGSHGDDITYPEGLSRYPYNGLIMTLIFGSFLFLGVGFLIIVND